MNKSTVSDLVLVEMCNTARMTCMHINNSQKNRHNNTHTHTHTTRQQTTNHQQKTSKAQNHTKSDKKHKIIQKKPKQKQAGSRHVIASTLPTRSAALSLARWHLR